MTKQAKIIAGLAVFALAVAGIVIFRGRDDGNGVTRPPSTTGANTTSPPPPSATLAELRLGLTQIATVQAPTALSARPDDTSLYVVEQQGRVRRLQRSGTTFTLEDAPVVDISDDVDAGGEQGLLGIAFSTDGTRMYLAFTNRDADQQVDEFTMQGNAVVDGSRRQLLVVPDFAPNHNGGDLITGPDGFLYYTMGDGGGGGDPQDTGQNPDDLLGAILRIDPTRPSGGRPYGIPADNPFANGGGAPEVWQYGLRNPWRMSFDRETRDLWIGDVGQNQVDEIDFVAAPVPGGGNFGWSDVEGTRPFEADEAPDGAIAPIHEYDHSGGRCSVTGGFVYRGKAIASLVGTYLFGDNCDGLIRGLARGADGSVTVTNLDMRVGGLSAFGEDNDGEMYVAGVVDGSVSRIDLVPAPGAALAPPTTAAPVVPATLSADPAEAADQLAQAETVLRDPASDEATLQAAAHLQQVAYRRLGRQPELFEMVISRAPTELQEQVRLNLDARAQLSSIPGSPLRDTLPAWRIIDPAPADQLLTFYREAEQQFGVSWNYLAAINLVETALGRIYGLSSAGAQGPMQFMPATWDAYGQGDINSPRDSILSAARYLNANGFADGNVDGALWNYNHSDHYVNAIKDIATVLAIDPRAFAGYYRWEVYYATTLGDVRLPVGYETTERISAADYIAAHPQEP